MKAAEKEKAAQKKPASLPQNIRTVLTAMFRCYPQSRWQLPLYAACKLSNPFMSALIPSLAIRMITEGNVLYFLAAVTAMVAVYWIRQAAENISNMYLNHARWHTTKKHFNISLVRKALTTDYLNIEPQPKQKILYQADYATSHAQKLMHETAEFTIQILGLLIYGTAVFTLDLRILLITLLLFVLDVILRNRAIKYDTGHWGEHAEVSRKRNYLERSSLDISAGKDIRIYRLQDCFHEHFNRLLAQEYRFQKNHYKRWYYPALSDGICSLMRDILAYSLLVGKVLAGDMDAAEFTLYIGMISGFTDLIYPLALSIYYLRNSHERFRNYHAFMDLQDTFLRASSQDSSGEKSETDGGRAASPVQKAPTIEFRDVSFCYEGSDTPVLSHLSFTLQAGEKVALVGNNGAGKTTLVKLLCGLYPASSGEILIDGQELGSMNLDTWQDRISAVFQDTIPMAFSVAMNVAGTPEKTLDRAKVRKSLEQAGLLEKIESLPKREDTCLTQQLEKDGILLSGGELQKLLLARSIYKDSAMLILDEPTSALDPIAESSMYEQYNSLAGGKTSLFISHRLASTKFCDRILFLENGRIAEAGTHAELMIRNGKYKEMFDIQSHYYKDSTEGQPNACPAEEGV